MVVAGGAGERFWPLSRRRLPKPLVPLLAGRTLLEATLERAARFAPPERTWVVCTRENAAALRRVAPIPHDRLLVEPQGRDTAMAMGFAAARIACDRPDAVLAVLPADHLIEDAAAFAAAIRRAARAAFTGDVLCTLGVVPTRPETGYGYIRVGRALGAAHPGLRRVQRFVEKPSAARARRYLRDGGYLWNAGIFVWKAGTLLEEIDRHAPDVAAALAPLRGRRAVRGAAVARAYRDAPKRSIDFAVLEHSRRIWTLPVDFGWSDVGSWGSLADVFGVAPGRSHTVAGHAILEDAHGNLVWAPSGRLVALLGVEGLAVIDAGDALLVTRLDRSADLRRVVHAIREQGRTDLL